MAKNITVKNNCLFALSLLLKAIKINLNLYTFNKIN